MANLPNFGYRDVAEVKAEGKNFRLFSEMWKTGIVAVVYDLKARQELQRPEYNSPRDSPRDPALRGVDGLLHCLHRSPEP